MSEIIMVRRVAVEIREAAERELDARKNCGATPHGSLCEPAVAWRLADLLDAIADAREQLERGPFWPAMSADPLIDVQPLGWQLAVDAATAYLVPTGAEPT